MAAEPSHCLFRLSCFSLVLFFLLFTLTNSEQSAPSLLPNVTLVGDWNLTSNDTDDFRRLEPRSPEEEELQPGGEELQPGGEELQPGGEEPLLPGEASLLPGEAEPPPLPLSGRLPAPAAVGDICPCDECRDVCDINCCCDAACGDEVSVFTGCSVSSVGGNRQLCSRDVASYSLGSTIDGYSTLRSSVQRESSSHVLCIQSQSGVDVLSHPSPALPTVSNFDSIFQQFTSFTFSTEESGGQVTTAEDSAFSGYQYGDLIVTVGESGERGRLWLPAPSVSAHCVDTNPAAFLMDGSSRCTRPVVLQRTCSTLSTLSMDSFTNIQVLSGKNDNPSVVPVEIASLVLQSVEGTQTELQMSPGESLRPVLLNPSLCANVVLKVAYLVKYTPAGEIVNVTLSLVMGFLHEAALPLQQEFQIAFVQDEATVHYSGNPGYVTGLPLVSGTRAADGIVRSMNPRETLSVLHSTGDQDCLRGRHQRSPVLFGVDFVSGCTFRMEEGGNCSVVLQALLSALRGANYPQYVASFGNSPLELPLDWLPIRSNFNPEETQSCSVPVSFHLEIKWTKYGSLVNPQAQLVSIQEVIQTNKSTLAWLSGGTSVLPIRSSVAFVGVSAAASPGYRATPTINAKLPADFFFPFV